MNNKWSINEYLQTNYYNQNRNYKSILSKIKEERTSNKRIILNLVATLCIAILGAAGLVWASTKLYKNNSVKKVEKINEEPKVILERGYTYFTKNSSLFINENMLYDQETNFYYKVITNIEEYSLYKAEEDLVPNMTKEDFNETALIIALSNGSRQFYEQDLSISEITADKTITHIVFKQNENAKINNVRERLPTMQ